MTWDPATNFNIYGFSRAREQNTIEDFLNYYIHRDKSERYHGLEITVWENEKYGIDEWFNIGGENVSLSEVIEYGVKNKKHGFTNYIYAPYCKSIVERVILHFTYDGALILGISTDAGEIHDINKYNSALKLERELIDRFGMIKTSIQRLTPPGKDEEEFDSDIKYWIERHKEDFNINPKL